VWFSWKNGGLTIYSFFQYMDLVTLKLLKSFVYKWNYFSFKEDEQNVTNLKHMWLCVFFSGVISWQINFNLYINTKNFNKCQDSKHRHLQDVYFNWLKYLRWLFWVAFDHFWTVSFRGVWAFREIIKIDCCLKSNRQIILSISLIQIFIKNVKLAKYFPCEERDGWVKW